VTLDELSAIIGRTPWFSRVGEFREREDAVPLAAVASSAAWGWLPTTPDAPDPIHGSSLPGPAEPGNRAAARREAERSIAKAVLASLRTVPGSHRRLVDGPHDFTRAAKGGALYAARMAAREIVAGRPGLWCAVVREYERGFWPCGLTDDGRRLVIY
jgi:hypothetical protein